VNAGVPPDYTGTAMTAVVVGLEVPPAGSTVIPIRSPGTTPEGGDHHQAGGDTTDRSGK